MAKIYFVTDSKYHWLRNISPHPILAHSMTFRTAEHLFQAYKFLGYRPKKVEEICGSDDPLVAAHTLDNEDDLRPDWYAINFGVMVLSVYAKFEQDPGLQMQLLATGNAELINNVTDAFWGTGADYLGQNNFGRALGEVREHFLRGTRPRQVPGVPGPAILFYQKGQPLYGFTNFSNHPVNFNGNWRTSEHLFQAYKFSLPKHQHLVDEIYNATNSREVFNIAQANQGACRSDWKQISIQVMRHIVYLKITQHNDLGWDLKGTLGRELIEDSPIDYFWGCGQDGTGKNKLGKTLVWVRNIIEYGLPPPAEPPNPPIPTTVRQQGKMGWLRRFMRS